MPDPGLRQRLREGQARAQAANLAEMGRPLEGPGAERRLARLQRRFRQVSLAARRGDRRVVTLAVLVFVTVVALGLWLTA